MTKLLTRAVLTGAIFHASLAASLLGFGLYYDHQPWFGASLADAQSVVPEPSSDAREFALWATASNDNAGLPVLVVDKARARLFSFNGRGRLQASTPVLLGASRDDGTDAPATPAGRFVADSWLSARMDGIVWVNDGTVLSLHGLPSASSPGRGM